MSLICHASLAGARALREISRFIASVMNEFDSSGKRRTKLHCGFVLFPARPIYGGLGEGAERLAGSFAPVCQPRLVPPPSFDSEALT